MRAPTPPNPNRTMRYTGASRRGVSFLEVVLGVTLLGLVASTFSMAVGAVGGAFQRQRDQLGAAEVANRLILMRVDDDDEAALPDPSMPIGYGDREFRWSMTESPVIVTLSEPAQAALSEREGNAIDLSRRMVSVTITAWLSERAGGAFNPDENVPQYSVTRLIDKLSFSTANSAERRLDTQEDMERFFGDVAGSMSSTGDVPTSGGGQPRTRPQTGQPRTGQLGGRGNRPGSSGGGGG